MKIFKQLAACLTPPNADRDKLLEDPLNPFLHLKTPQCGNSEMLQERSLFISTAKMFFKKGKTDEADMLISKYRWSFFSLWSRYKENPAPLRAMTNCFLLSPEYSNITYFDLSSILKDETAKTVLDLTVVYIDLARLSNTLHGIYKRPSISFSIQKLFKDAAEAQPPNNCSYPATTQDKIESNIRGYCYSNRVGSHAYYHLDQLDGLSPGLDWENPAISLGVLEKFDSCLPPAINIKV